MRRTSIIFLIILSAYLNINAQKIDYLGKYFIAYSVANADSTSNWYENIFNMKLVKEIDVEQVPVHLRIIENENLIIEIVEHKNTSSNSEPPVEQKPSNKKKGITKSGIFVSDLAEAEKFFTGKGIKLARGPFDDPDTGVKSFIIQDINGYMIQFFEKLKK